MVTNVSFASPYAGDQGFRDYFYELEQNNKIRHLRITNDEETVPLAPPVALGRINEAIPRVETTSTPE